MSAISRSFAQKLPRVGSYLTAINFGGLPSFTYPKIQEAIATTPSTPINPTRIQEGKLYNRLGKVVHQYNNNKKSYVYANIKALDGTNLGEDAENDAYFTIWTSINTYNQDAKFYLTG